MDAAGSGRGRPGNAVYAAESVGDTFTPRGQRGGEAGAGRGYITLPPVTTMVCPVTYAAPAHRKSITSA